MKCRVEMGSDGVVYILCFMNTGVAVRALLRFRLSNLKGCNVGITDGRDL
jgi:hypothetical protein